MHDNFGPGNKIVEIADDNPYVCDLAFSTRYGEGRVLLIKKRDRKFDVSATGAAAGQISLVDQITNFQPPATAKLSSNTVTFGGCSVAVLTLPYSGEGGIEKA